MPEPEEYFIIPRGVTKEELIEILNEVFTAQFGSRAVNDTGEVEAHTFSATATWENLKVFKVDWRQEQALAANLRRYLKVKIKFRNDGAATYAGAVRILENENRLNERIIYIPPGEERELEVITFQPPLYFAESTVKIQGWVNDLSVSVVSGEWETQRRFSMPDSLRQEYSPQLVGIPIYPTPAIIPRFTQEEFEKGWSPGTDPGGTRMPYVSDQHLHVPNLSSVVLLGNFHFGRVIGHSLVWGTNPQAGADESIGFGAPDWRYGYVGFRIKDTDFQAMTKTMDGEETVNIAWDPDYSVNPHDFDIVWTPDAAKFYIDGVLVATIKQFIPQIPLGFRYHNADSFTSELEVYPYQEFNNLAGNAPVGFTGREATNSSGLINSHTFSAPNTWETIAEFDVDWREEGRAVMLRRYLDVKVKFENTDGANDHMAHVRVLENGNFLREFSRLIQAGATGVVNVVTDQPPLYHTTATITIQAQVANTAVQVVADPNDSRWDTQRRTATEELHRQEYSPNLVGLAVWTTPTIIPHFTQEEFEKGWAKGCSGPTPPYVSNMVLHMPNKTSATLLGNVLYGTLYGCYVIWGTDPVAGAEESIGFDFPQWRYGFIGFRIKDDKFQAVTRSLPDVAGDTPGYMETTDLTWNPDYAVNYHSFDITWRPDAVFFYIDGNLVAVHHQYISHGPAGLVFKNDDAFTSEMKIHYGFELENWNGASWARMLPFQQRKLNITTTDGYTDELLWYCHSYRNKAVHIHNTHGDNSLKYRVFVYLAEGVGAPYPRKEETTLRPGEGHDIIIDEPCHLIWVQIKSAKAGKPATCNLAWNGR